MNVKSVASRAFAWPQRTFKRFGADRAAPMAASIAFYSAFSLAPTLVMVIAVAGLVFGAEAARGQLFHQINGMLGKDAAASVQAIVEHAHQSGGSGVAAAMSFVLLAVGASATLAGAAMDGCAGFIEQIVEDGGKMVDIEMTAHGGQSVE